MAKKLDVVIPPTDKTAEEVAKALFKLSPRATKPYKATAASASPDRDERGRPRSES